MLHIIVRGCWCDTVLNVHKPREDKNDDIKDTIYKDQFLKYHMKTMLDLNAKVGKEDIFKPAIGNESLHEISNDKWGTVVNFVT
jgi:hypothetical protein